MAVGDDASCGWHKRGSPPGSFYNWRPRTVNLVRFERKRRFNKKQIELIADNYIFDTENVLLVRVGKELDLDLAGAWLKVEETSRDLGWYFSGKIPPDIALSCIEPSEDREKLENWTRKQGLDLCAFLARSVGGINPYTDIR
jgi:hypothetical protein